MWVRTWARMGGAGQRGCLVRLLASWRDQRAGRDMQVMVARLPVCLATRLKCTVRKAGQSRLQASCSQDTVMLCKWFMEKKNLLDTTLLQVLIC